MTSGQFKCGVTIVRSGLIVAGLAICPFAWSASFQVLPDLPGGNSFVEVFGVSANGRFVVGSSNSDSGREAFAWERNQGITPLGSLDSSTFFSEARAVSNDGETAVGISWLGNDVRGFRYRNGVMESVGVIEQGEIDPQSRAFAITPDGSVLGGSASTSSAVHAILKIDDTWTDLGTLDGGSGIANVHDLSYDGGVAIGQSTSLLGRQAFRWDSLGGMLALGFLDPADRYSNATAVSGNGSTVVGWSRSMGGEEAFMYRDGVMHGLGDDPTNGTRSIAHDVDSDGSTIVGRIGTRQGFEAGIWIDGGEPELLHDYLGKRGVDVPIELIEATGVSADGFTIVGNGFLEGRRVGWVAQVPEPSIAALLSAFLVALLLRRPNRASVST